MMPYTGMDGFRPQNLQAAQGAMLKDQELVKWLEKKLGDLEGWVGRGTSALVSGEMLDELMTCFQAVEPQTKLKLMLSYPYISQRNVNMWRESMNSLLGVSRRDPDDWVELISELYRDVPARGMINTQPANENPVFSKTISDLQTLLGAHDQLGNLCAIPKSLNITSASVRKAAVGEEKPDVIHFTLKKKPKSYFLLKDLEKQSEIANNQKKDKSQSIISSTVPIKIRSTRRECNNTLPMKGIPTQNVVKMSAGFTNEPKKNQRQLPNRDRATKLIDFDEIPQPTKIRRQSEMEEKRKQRLEEKEAAKRKAIEEKKQKEDARRADQQRREEEAKALAEKRRSEKERQARNEQKNAILSIQSRSSPSESQRSPSKNLPKKLTPVQIRQEQQRRLSSLSQSSTELPSPVTSPRVVHQQQQQLHHHQQQQNMEREVASIRAKMQHQQEQQRHQQEEQQRQQQQQMMQQQQQQQMARVQLAMDHAPPPMAQQFIFNRNMQTNHAQQSMNPTQIVNQPQFQQAFLVQNKQHEEQAIMKQCQDILQTANALDDPGKNMVMNFMRGNKQNPHPELGHVITLKLSETVEDGVSEGQLRKMKVETFFQMDYESGEWKRLRKCRLLEPHELQAHLSSTNSWQVPEFSQQPNYANY